MLRKVDFSKGVHCLSNTTHFALFNELFLDKVRDWFIYMAIKVYKKKENWKLNDFTVLKQFQTKQTTVFLQKLVTKSIAVGLK